MELKRLKHLVALADERNFARAAERVHLSQPAFSRSIQAAEAELDIQLFDRGTIEATPTPAGMFVLERARKLLFESRCLERDIGLYRKNLIGTLSFGVGPFPAATLLPTLIPEMRQSYAGVHLRIEVNNWAYLVQHLRDEELDFFVADIRDVPAAEDLEVSRLARQYGGFYVRAGHPLLERTTIRPADINQYGIATVRLPQAIRLAVTQLLELEPGTPMPLALECDDVQTLKRAAQGSDTVLAIVHSAVAEEVGDGILVELEFENVPKFSTDMGIVSLRGRSHSPVADFVIARLKALANQIAADMDSVAAGRKRNRMER